MSGDAGNFRKAIKIDNSREVRAAAREATARRARSVRTVAGAAVMGVPPGSDEESAPEYGDDDVADKAPEVVPEVPAV